MKRTALLLCALGLTACQGAAFVRPPAPLTQLHEFMQGEIDSGDYLGAVTLIARHGKVVDWHAFGHRDLARTLAMDPDSIFRIYSMTKTVTTVAVLMLMEDGRFSLDDPVALVLPEFADMPVFIGGTADAPQLRAARRPITIRNLLMHAAGFAVGGKDAPESVRMLERADLGSSTDLATYCARLGRVPLAVDPGSRFNYDGVQIVVLGRIVEVVAGVSFEDFLQQRIFAPLRMMDTGFSVPEVKRGRIVEMTSTDSDGRLIPAPEYVGTRPGDTINPYHSGAGGLYSTAADYLRFSQMLLNGGRLDGVSILRNDTIGMMMTNQLDRLDPPVTEFRPGEGFGLGGSVVVDVAARGRPGSMGQFGWSGAASTYYSIDPREGLIAMLLIQHLPQGLPRDPPKISATFYNLVYQALVKQSLP
ncbi:MAG: beta-lactamase [Steroidobacteraceae bacterium]|nr:beta-lactamase [Steroidobacteraceae bacterium]